MRATHVEMPVQETEEFEEYDEAYPSRGQTPSEASCGRVEDPGV